MAANAKDARIPQGSWGREIDAPSEEYIKQGTKGREEEREDG